MAKDKEEEEALQETLKSLDRKFSVLMVAVRSSLDDKLQHQQLVLVNFIRWIEQEINLIGELSDITDLNELFKKLHPYFDFLDCELIVDMSEEFLNDVCFEKEKGLVIELKEHKVKANTLHSSITVKQLKDELESIYFPRLTNLSNMPQIYIKLQNRWNQANIKKLYLLIQHLLPYKSNQSILKHIEITTGSVCIKYIVHKSNTDCLIAYAQGKLQFMRLIGIFGLTINGELIFRDDENKNYTFDTALLKAANIGHVEAIQFILELGANIDGALLEAVKVGHIESLRVLLELGGNVNNALLEAAKHGHSGAVCLLLKLGASINHYNKEGKTPLMLATLGGHEQVVQTLVSAGADVYIQDNNNYTALTIACEMNLNTICNYLLQQRKVHETAFITACRHVCSNVIALLQWISSHITINSSDKIVANIQILNKKFGSLVSNIKERFSVLIKNGSCKLVTIAQRIEEYTEEKGFTKVTTIDELFNKIKSHYHFLNCHLIEHLVQYFLWEDVLKSKVKEYSDDLRVFEESAKLIDIQNASEKIHLSKQDVTEPTCKLIIKLNVIWKQMTLNSLRILINYIFAEKGKHLNHIHIEHESLCITFLAPSSQYHCLKDMAVSKRDLLYQLGIFEMCINNHPIIVKNANDNFTFEPSLLQAAKDGLIENMDLLLELCACVHYRSTEKEMESNEMNIVTTALYIASRNGHYQVVELLLKQKANPNFQSNNGVTILHIASQNGHYQVVKLLLKEQANPNIKEKEDCTALMIASQNGHYQVVELLLKQQANPNIQNNDGVTALYIASQNGHYQVVELLLKQQSNPNIKEKKDWTALMIASEKGHYQVVKLLLKQQADPNIQNNNGVTALYIASQNGHYQVVELLLKQQAEPNIQNNNGVTALYIASQNGHYQVVELLLKQQTDPNIQYKNGVTALHIASQNGHYEVVKLLLTKQANPNIQNNDGLTTLHLASKNGHYQVVELLLKQQADPNSKEKEDWTALMIASENGHYQVVELLLKQQANPNIKEKEDWTALMIASQNGHYQVVELLLKQQADPNIQNNNGVTALHIASQNGHYQVVELLLKQQADPNIQQKEDWTALMIASQNSHYQVVELLLNQQADPNIQNNNEVTALHIASQNGHYQVVNLLLKEQANRNIKEKKIGLH